MERIKRFYRDHDIATKFLAAGAVVGGLVLIRIANGYKLDDADIWMRQDGSSIVMVQRRNGRTATFYKEPEKV